MTDHAANERYVGGNRLIDSMEAGDRAFVVDRLTMMVADEASGGITGGERIAAAYFPIDAVFSVLVEIDGGDCYEVDTIGRSGFVGAELLLGFETASRSVICQVGGRFARLPVEAFEACMTQAPSFTAAMQRALLLQWYRAQQTIACNFAHSLVERCARWTALTHDAVGRPEFLFRAEYLSMMLGEQTNVVAQPMATLQAIGAIRYGDDRVQIVSERTLLDAACPCYVAPIEYSKQVVPRRRERREAP